MTENKNYSNFRCPNCGKTNQKGYMNAKCSFCNFPEHKKETRFFKRKLKK